jgi:hypothetical protein
MVTKKLKLLGQGVVVYTGNLRYLGGNDLEDCVSRPVWEKKLARLHPNQ